MPDKGLSTGLLGEGSGEGASEGASDRAAGGRILGLEELLAWRGELARRGRRLVQCHGCFDIVHPGHVRHLRWARAQGDALLVTVTGDRGVGKGAGRPLIPEELRAENLAALDVVDAVHVVREPTALGILRAVRPDIYVKGREYEANNDPRFEAERQAVRDAGGRVVFSSGDVVFSSSALIEALDSGLDGATSALASLVRRPGLSASRLGLVLDAARGARVLVVGEAVREVYRLCESPEVAEREAAMTLRPVEERRFDAGAAGVARHLAAMGCRPTLLTCAPEGEAGRGLRARLAGDGVELVSLADAGEPMELEHFLVGAHKALSVDRRTPLTLDTALRDGLVSRAEQLASQGLEAAVVVDHGLGLLPGPVVGGVCEAVRPRAGVLAAQAPARGGRLLAARGADVLCPSEADLRRSVGNNAGGLTAAAWAALEASGAKGAIVSLGAEGLVAFDRLETPVLGEGDGWPARLRAEAVPSLAPVPLDPAGSQGALLAAATAALAGQRRLDDNHAGAMLAAAVFAAAAEAVASQRLGHAAVSAADLRRTLARLHGAHLVYREPDATPTRAAS